ncbi:M23 family metallopeptidase [Tessaracoccus sp.]|uniref:M23 family metallopeptidase n=1 Tax=Tessaracoccus sp. TaxID=1971211 RepID=UPI0026385898|nr:M23 family metallopeptidase [Tessaracoccus sp.]
MALALALVGSIVAPAVPAVAASGDFLAKGQQYCADTYSAHSHDGRPATWLVDINFPGDGGAPLYAPGAGTVTSGWAKGPGNFVWWTSADGVESIYLGHLATFGKTGAVNGGEQIGTIGDTGDWASGAHLHVHRNVNGKAAPVVLSGVTINPVLDPGVYGKWPCNGTTYTSAGPSGAAPAVIDSDGDGVPDAVDQCPFKNGEGSDSGCPDRRVLLKSKWGPADCSRVGTTSSQKLLCEIQTSSGWIKFASPAGDWGYAHTRGWLANADGTVSHCGAVGTGNQVRCDTFNGTGWESKTSSATDLGYRDQADGRVFLPTKWGPAQCGRAGDQASQALVCNIQTSSGWKRYSSPRIDWGYDHTRGWVANVDGTVSHCGAVGTGIQVRCDTFNGTGWESKTSSATDLGYRDQADGRVFLPTKWGPAQCGRAGDQASQALVCNVQTSSGWKRYSSPRIDWGYDHTRGWVANVDGTVSHCGAVGTGNQVRCDTFNGTGWESKTSSATDLGYREQNDGRVFLPTKWGPAQCGRAGDQAVQALVCNVQTSSGWKRYSSGKGDWGYSDTRGWVANSDGTVSHCGAVGTGNQVRCDTFNGTGWESETSVTNAASFAGWVKSATPTLAGTMTVGKTLTAAPGAWADGAALSYQWRADGKVLEGATTSSLALVTAHVGKKLSVTVTGSKSGYVAVSKTSAQTAAVAAAPSPKPPAPSLNPTPTPSPVPTTPSPSPEPTTPSVKRLTATPVPVITGSVEVGKKLTAAAGEWKSSGVVLLYQWYRSGQKIAKATGQTYKLTAADKGATISVKVSGKKSGYITVTKMSAVTKKVAAGTLSATPKPKISGSVKVGEKLIVKPGCGSR